MKRFFLLLLLTLTLTTPAFIAAASLYSPTWGFLLDLPEGYEYTDGDGTSRFSFSGPSEAIFDIVVYNGTYASINDLVNDVTRRIGNRGDAAFYQYRDKQAALIELDFGNAAGYGLCVELAPAGNTKPFLLALAYGPRDVPALQLFHISALDSICPTVEERYYPGPVIEYSFPRGEQKRSALASTGVSAMIRENDARAAQVLIEREFTILANYADTPFWQDAWIRYYRFIYRDSFDRIAPAANALVQSWNGQNANTDETKRAFAQRALSFVQGFGYERDLNGSDFLNLVTAVTEGRGDCDPRAMLFAIILNHAGIRAAIMVSPHYSHAMGLADIAGTGARFELYDLQWLVAETTANVNIGLIDQEQNNPRYWIGVFLD
jgi:hypothetical protein